MKKGGREATRDALFIPKLDHALVGNHYLVLSILWARARVLRVRSFAKLRTSEPREAGTREGRVSVWPSGDVVMQ
jgi:hypothetical protein